MVLSSSHTWRGTTQMYGKGGYVACVGWEVHFMTFECNELGRKQSETPT